MDNRKAPYGFGLENKSNPHYESDWDLEDEDYTDFSNQEDDKKTIRIWCTQCDIDMEDKGVALDCPKDGRYYECPKCKFRIVVFEGNQMVEELYQKALEFWGKDLQLNMVFEELGELITKLSRVIRTRIPPTDLAEEIVDVEIMLEQLTYIYKLEEQVQHAKTEKLVRLQEKLGIQEKILWYNNTECPQCGKLIEDPKKIRACETGYSYCSEECAREHVKDIYQEE